MPQSKLLVNISSISRSVSRLKTRGQSASDQFTFEPETRSSTSTQDSGHGFHYNNAGVGSAPDLESEILSSEYPSRSNDSTPFAKQSGAGFHHTTKPHYERSGDLAASTGSRIARPKSGFKDLPVDVSRFGAVSVDSPFVSPFATRLPRAVSRQPSVASSASSDSQSGYPAGSSSNIRSTNLKAMRSSIKMPVSHLNKSTKVNHLSVEGGMKVNDGTRSPLNSHLPRSPAALKAPQSVKSATSILPLPHPQVPVFNTEPPSPNFQPLLPRPRTKFKRVGTADSSLSMVTHQSALDPSSSLSEESSKMRRNRPSISKLQSDETEPMKQEKKVTRKVEVKSTANSNSTQFNSKRLSNFDDQTSSAGVSANARTNPSVLSNIPASQGNLTLPTAGKTLKTVNTSKRSGYMEISKSTDSDEIKVDGLSEPHPEKRTRLIKTLESLIGSLKLSRTINMTALRLISDDSYPPSPKEAQSSINGRPIDKNQHNRHKSLANLRDFPPVLLERSTSALSTKSLSVSSKVMGRSLQHMKEASCITHIGNQKHSLPIIVVMTIEEIYKNGTRIYKNPETTNDLPSIDELIEVFNTAPHYGTTHDFSKENVQTLYEVLKAYLNALPHPLLDQTLWKLLWTFCANPEGKYAGLQAFEITATQRKIQIAKIILLLMPSPYFSLLAYVIAFLYQITLVQENFASPQTLAEVFGPALLSPRNPAFALKAVSNDLQPSSSRDSSQALMWLLENWKEITSRLLQDQTPDLSILRPELNAFTPNSTDKSDERKTDATAELSDPALSRISQEGSSSTNHIESHFKTVRQRQLLNQKREGLQVGIDNGEFPLVPFTPSCTSTVFGTPTTTDNTSDCLSSAVSIFEPVVAPSFQTSPDSSFDLSVSCIEKATLTSIKAFESPLSVPSIHQSTPITKEPLSAVNNSALSRSSETEKNSMLARHPAVDSMVPENTKFVLGLQSELVDMPNTAAAVSQILTRDDSKDSSSSDFRLKTAEEKEFYGRKNTELKVPRSQTPQELRSSSASGFSSSLRAPSVRRVVSRPEFSRKDNSGDSREALNSFKSSISRPEVASFLRRSVSRGEAQNPPKSSISRGVSPLGNLGSDPLLTEKTLAALEKSRLLQLRGAARLKNRNLSSQGVLLREYQLQIKNALAQVAKSQNELLKVCQTLENLETQISNGIEKLKK